VDFQMDYDEVPLTQRRVGVRAVFYERAKRNAEQSEKTGLPVWEQKEYIKIQQPGDKTSIIDRPIRPSDKVEFRAQYEAYKANKNQDTAGGHPIDQWPALPPDMVEALKESKVFTIEQLAAISDSNAQQMGAIRKWRDMAKDYVSAAAGGAPLVAMRAELEAKNNELETLKQQMAALMADMKSLKEPKQKSK
jgi:hypothetical protein